MKNFFKQCTHNPYVDWAIIAAMGGIGIVLVAVWSFVTYTTVSHVEVVTNASSTKPITVDVSKLNTIVETLKKKSEIFDAPRLPMIDVREPSL